MTQLNWSFLEKWLKELKFLKEKRTLRIEPFSIWLKDWTYFSVWLKELSPSCQYYSKNWTLFLNMSQWIEPFFRWLNKNWTLIFKIWLKDLSPLSKIWPSRIEPFWKMWLIEIELLSMIQRFFFFWKRLTEPRIDFLQFDSNTWIWLKTLNLFFNITQRIEFFL